ncbi:CoB--CoM heterodisulfide reductase, subunit B [Methanocella conradii HZ254]|uniref:CoB--CoM heterodisulfide reductase, subunit B n=1 Tax=Methanocella conradii (strain DSM 24694 / JCM 17849 / CGMCC 1.5162 / HZ254) TaxID=1041930 RepID=H8I7I9_METCZ|nr:CoB--CoM heterodisulfide reductase subunit B [Methanocella conradii]AFD01199.1 CoB--CoM heterodisulfide reductase, subunit B [Methanocella conradii HZ254]MDI6896960.1 CoB--CoM heterodisulfide reductase subunit B [Methanocella conradii]
MSETKFKSSLFLGCIAPNRYPGIEASTIKTAKNLGLELVDLKGAGCCPAPGAFGSMDILTWEALAARNICLSEQMGLDCSVLCNGCYKSLYDVNERLKENPAEKAKVNDLLKLADMQFKGSIEIRHVAEQLYTDVGLKKIRDSVVQPLNGIKVGIHYGCHLLKPGRDRKFGSAAFSTEVPTFLDEMVEVLGARSVNYKDKMMCCGAGGGVRGYKIDFALDMTNEKLKNMSQVGVDCVVDVCPFCHLQFDRGQLEIKEKFGDSYDIPVLHYGQLLGLAQGMSPDELGLEAHVIKVDSLLDKIV